MLICKYLLLLISVLQNSYQFHVLVAAADNENENDNQNGNGNGNNEDGNEDGRDIYEFEQDCAGIPDDYRKETLIHNTNALTDFLNSKASNAALYFEDKTYHFYPGVYGQQIVDFSMYINGTLRFHRPNVTVVNHYDRPEPCIFIEDSEGITISSPDPSFEDDGNNDYDFDNNNGKNEYYVDTNYASTNRGIIDGDGARYWGIPFIGYLELVEFRPNLLVLNRTSDVLIEYLIFRDAALYTLLLHDVNNLELRYSSVVARRTQDDGHTLYDLSAFNTDGIDVSGTNVYVHDVDIWNQDDCIAVKDSYLSNSSNMLFERIHASGLGLTVGSIGGTTVSNITFRDSLLYRSYKGIYMKFRVDTSRNTSGLVENVLYENITIFEPEQWGIWIGPAQQAISGNPCKANPCSLCWPTVPFTKCEGSKVSQFKDIVLRNINIINPLGSPGIILGSDAMPINGITFENVVVTRTIPAAYQNANRFELFPGLTQPIQDPYMFPVFVWVYTIAFSILVLGIAGLTVLGLFHLFGIGKKKEGSEDSERSEPLLEKKKEESNWFLGEGKTYVLIAGGVLVAAGAQYVVKRSEYAYNSKQYFTCEGVVDGVATGSTWPVPSCFEDATDASS